MPKPYHKVWASSDGVHWTYVESESKGRHFVFAASEARDVGQMLLDYADHFDQREGEQEK